MPRTPAKSPGSKSTPGSKGKRDVAETPSRKPSNMTAAANVEGDGVEGSASDAAPEAESATVTPARKAGKRKAAGEDETPNSNRNSNSNKTNSSKKPKVYAQESVSTSDSTGKKHTHTSVKLEIPVSTPTTTKPAGKHIVFSNDDEPSEYFTPQETPGQKTLDAEVPKAGDEDEEDDDGDDESDSDDDAPEAVSTHAAAAQAAKSAQAATSAAAKQQELQKRRRQDRDARFREQAEARRKQAEKQKAAAGDDDAAADKEARLGLEQPREHIPSLASAPTRKRLDKYTLPAVLPDDFLEAASLDGSENDDDDDDDSEGEEESGRRRRGASGKAKFNTVARQVARAESRQPRDQRVGATVYRVMKKQGDVRLAPRLGRQSRNAKEAMMGRGRPAAKKAGFLAKRR